MKDYSIYDIFKIMSSYISDAVCAMNMLTIKAGKF